VAPRFTEIDAELGAVSELKDKPSGTVRITSTENAAEGCRLIMVSIRGNLKGADAHCAIERRPKHEHLNFNKLRYPAHIHYLSI
jgi:hypothetical protein